MSIRVIKYGKFVVDIEENTSRFFYTIVPKMNYVVCATAASATEDKQDVKDVKVKKDIDTADNYIGIRIKELLNSKQVFEPETRHLKCDKYEKDNNSWCPEGPTFISAETEFSYNIKTGKIKRGTASFNIRSLEKNEIKLDGLRNFNLNAKLSNYVHKQEPECLFLHRNDWDRVWCVRNITEQQKLLNSILTSINQNYKIYLNINNNDDIKDDGTYGIRLTDPDYSSCFTVPWYSASDRSYALECCARVGAITEHNAKKLQKRLLLVTDDQLKKNKKHYDRCVDLVKLWL